MKSARGRFEANRWEKLHRDEKDVSEDRERGSTGRCIICILPTKVLISIQSILIKPAAFAPPTIVGLKAKSSLRVGVRRR